MKGNWLALRLSVRAGQSAAWSVRLAPADTGVYRKWTLLEE
jgi:hypothetical protein